MTLDQTIDGLAVLKAIGATFGTFMIGWCFIVMYRGH